MLVQKLKCLLLTFYEEHPFYLACIVAGAFLIWLMYRVARLGREYQIRLNERMLERNRIGRELHDTLLQSLVGVSLQLKVVSDLLGPDYGTSLERIRQQVEDTLREARQSVITLRCSTLHSRDLVEALREVGAALTVNQPIRLNVSVNGTSQPHSKAIDEQVLRIAQQAIGNAVMHSGCSEIHVRLEYQKRFLRFSVQDNGAGMDPNMMAVGRPGHYGLQNMRERAEAVGGEMSIGAEPGRGCVIAVCIPFPPPSRFFWPKIPSRAPHQPPPKWSMERPHR